MQTASASQAPATPDGAPANVARYVRAIGASAAAELFLRFGGRPVYLSAKPRARAPLVEAIGAGAASALFAEFGRGHLKVPMAKGWVARQLDAAGAPRAEIAQRLHVTRESVRGYLALPREKARA